MTRSGCILAHVRAASVGLPVTETNTHPFVWRRHAFMHNGEVASFPAIKRSLLDQLGQDAYGMIEGTTDSEHLFALFIERWLRAGETQPQESLARALEGAVADMLTLLRDAGIEAASTFNLAVADGTCAVACRFATGDDSEAPSLHVHTGKHYHCDAGVPRLVTANAGEHAVIVSSEPLTDDSEWRAVPPNHVVVIGSDRRVEIRRFSPE